MGSDDLINTVHTALASCVDGLPRAICAYLATCDGHLIHVYGHRDTANLAVSLPVSGSLLGLARTLATDLHQNAELDDATSEQVLSMVSVGDRDQVLFVGVIGERLINLGQLLVRSKQAAEQIRSAL